MSNHIVSPILVVIFLYKLIEVYYSILKKNEQHIHDLNEDNIVKAIEKSYTWLKW